MNIKINVTAVDMQKFISAMEESAQSIADAVFDNNGLTDFIDNGVSYELSRDNIFENLPSSMQKILEPMILPHLKQKILEAFMEWMNEQ